MGTTVAYAEVFKKKLLSTHGEGRFELILFKEVDRTFRYDRRVILKCVDHNLNFDVSVKQHWEYPHGGCPKCKEVMPCISRYNKYMPIIQELHGNTYTYQTPEDFGFGGKLVITCKVHGNFKKRIGDHLRKENPQGCPKCTPVETAFSYSQFMSSCERNGNPTLYIIRCFNESESFIKVGITGKGVKGRYRGPQAMPYGYEVLNEYNGTPEEVWNLEKLIGSLFRQDFGYRPKINFKGSMYECYKFE